MFKAFYIAILALVLLSGCGGSDEQGEAFPNPEQGVFEPEPEEPQDSDDPEVEDPEGGGGEIPTPPADAQVMTIEGTTILDATGEAFMARGINLQYGDNPSIRLAGIAPIAETQANIVRLQLRRNTTASQLEDALDALVEQDLVAMPMLWEEDITCSNDAAVLLDDVDNLWLGEWLPVLASAEYQDHLMINIANEWGPMNVFDPQSSAYDEWVSTYESIITGFRDAGFKVPLVIDAAHCGQDFYVYLGGRGQQLLEHDPETNLIFSPHAYFNNWNTAEKVKSNMKRLQDEGYSVLLGEFGGSGFQAPNDVDHINLIQQGAGDGSLVFDIPWGDPASDKILWRHILAEPIDMSAMTLSVEVYMPQSYVDDGNLLIKPFMKDVNWTFAAPSGISASELQGGQWNQIDFAIVDTDSLETANDGFDITQVDKLGIEIFSNGKPIDVTGKIFVGRYFVTESEGTGSLVTDTFASDSQLDNWEFDFGEGVSQSEVTESRNEAIGDDGALGLDVNWQGPDDKVLWRRVNVPEVDLTGKTLRMDVWVPQEYVQDGRTNIKPFVKDVDWVFANFSTINVAELEGDAWNSIEIPTITEESIGFASDGFDITRVDKIGIEIAASGKPASITGPIYIDNAGITGTRETLFSEPFVGNIDDWEFDWAEGSLDETLIMEQNVVFHSTELSADPYGWIAWSWKGNGGDAVLLDMSNQEGEVDLTQRGEEIVNGLYGIKNTAEKAGFVQ